MGEWTEAIVIVLIGAFGITVAWIVLRHPH
jgi:hypothetical protein